MFNFILFLSSKKDCNISSKEKGEGINKCAHSNSYFAPDLIRVLLSISIYFDGDKDKSIGKHIDSDAYPTIS